MKQLIKVYKRDQQNNEYSNLYFDILSNEYYNKVLFTISWVCNKLQPLRNYDNVIIIDANQWYDLRITIDHKDINELKALLPAINKVIKRIEGLQDKSPTKIFFTLLGELAWYEPNLGTYIGISMEGKDIYKFLTATGEIYAQRIANQATYKEIMKELGPKVVTAEKLEGEKVTFLGERFDVYKF